MVTVGAILGETARFVRREWLAIAIWCALFATSRFLLQQFVPPTPPDASILDEFWTRTAPRGLVVLIEMPIFYAACLRASATPDPNEELFYLRAGGDELRLAGLTLFLGIALGVLWLITLALIAAMGALFAALAGGFGLFVAALLYLAAIGALLFAIVCLTPVWPLTVVQHRFALDAGWALGRAHFWRLLGAYAVIWLILIAIGLLLLAMFAPDFLWILTHLGAPEARATIDAAVARHSDAGFLPRIGFAIESGLASGIILAAHVGSIGCATRLILAERSAKSDGALPGPWGSTDGSEE